MWRIQRWIVLSNWNHGKMSFGRQAANRRNVITREATQFANLIEVNYENTVFAISFPLHHSASGDESTQYLCPRDLVGGMRCGAIFHLVDPISYFVPFCGKPAGYIAKPSGGNSGSASLFVCVQHEFLHGSHWATALLRIHLDSTSKPSFVTSQLSSFCQLASQNEIAPGSVGWITWSSCEGEHK